MHDCERSKESVSLTEPSTTTVTAAVHAFDAFTRASRVTGAVFKRFLRNPLGAVTRGPQREDQILPSWGPPQPGAERGRSERGRPLPSPAPQRGYETLQTPNPPHPTFLTEGNTARPFCKASKAAAKSQGNMAFAKWLGEKKRLSHCPAIPGVVCGNLFKLQKPAPT